MDDFTLPSITKLKKMVLVQNHMYHPSIKYPEKLRESYIKLFQNNDFLGGNCVRPTLFDHFDFGFFDYSEENKVVEEVELNFKAECLDGISKLGLTDAVCIAYKVYNPYREKEKIIFLIIGYDSKQCLVIYKMYVDGDTGYMDYSELTTESFYCTFLKIIKSDETLLDIIRQSPRIFDILVKYYDFESIFSLLE